MCVASPPQYSNTCYQAENSDGGHLAGDIHDLPTGPRQLRRADAMSGETMWTYAHLCGYVHTRRAGNFITTVSVALRHQAQKRLREQRREKPDSDSALVCGRSDAPSEYPYTGFSRRLANSLPLARSDCSARRGERHVPFGGRWTGQSPMHAAYREQLNGGIGR
jgi:hypothetical protein